MFVQTAAENTERREARNRLKCAQVISCCVACRVALFGVFVLSAFSARNVRRNCRFRVTRRNAEEDGRCSRITIDENGF